MKKKFNWGHSLQFGKKDDERRKPTDKDGQSTYILISKMTPVKKGFRPDKFIKKGLSND